MNKYEIRTEQKKNAIIQAAFELFNQNGFSNTNIKEIAASASVSQVTIYNYFGSKEALVAECSKVIMQQTIEHAREILTLDLNFKDKLIKALDACSSGVNLSFSKYLSEIALSDPMLIKLLQENINVWKRQVFQDYIELGKQEGVIDSSITTEIVLKFIDSLNHIKLDPNNIQQEQMQIHQLFLYGILGENK